MNQGYRVERTVTKMEDGGRLVIPAEYRRALGVEPGDELVLVLEENSVRILTPREGIRRAQALVRSYVPEGDCLSDELIRERRPRTHVPRASRFSGLSDPL